MLLDRQGPAAFRGRETTARVLVAAGPYRLSGEWWKEDGSDGRGRRRGVFARLLGRARLRRRRVPRAPGRRNGRWYLDGYYD